MRLLNTSECCILLIIKGAAFLLEGQKMFIEIDHELKNKILVLFEHLVTDTNERAKLINGFYKQKPKYWDAIYNTLLIEFLKKIYHLPIKEKNQRKEKLLHDFKSWDAERQIRYKILPKIIEETCQ